MVSGLTAGGVLASLLLFASAAHAQTGKGTTAKAIAFGKDVVPVLRTACLGCHSGATPSGGYSVASYDDVVRPGRNGAVVVAGKPSESRLFRLVAGLSKPTMPPGAGLKANDIEILRRWIESGAKRDPIVGKSTVAAIPSGIASAAPRAEFAVPGKLRASPAPVNALAFSPDGRILAIGTYQRVVFVDVASGKTTTEWSGHADAVRSLVFTPDGATVLAGGGLPGAYGEVRVWSTAREAEASVFGDHADAVHAIALHPDGKRLVTASADKVVKVWDWSTGKVLQTLRDHSDAVHGASFHPGGKYLVTCGSDKSAKVWDIETGKRLYSIGASDELVTDVQFSGNGNQILTAGIDKRVRRWNFGPEGAGHAGDMGHALPVWGIAVSGDRTASGGGDGKVHLFNSGNGEIATFDGPAEWIYCVRFSPDGSRLAAGTFDGRVFVWDAANRKVVATITTAPTVSAK